MKRLILCSLLFIIISNLFGQADSVVYTQQVAYYATQFFNGGTFANNSVADVKMNTSVNTGSQVVAWRKLNTAIDNTGTDEVMKIGDRFTATVSATRAKGEIGVALLASPTSRTTFSDRVNNYAVSVNMDGPDSTGAGYGNWYVRFANGDTLQASFGGAQSSYSDFQIDFTLSATNRMNVYITNLTNPTQYFAFHDILLNTSNPISEYSIYLSDADDSSGTSKNIIWKQETALVNTGLVSVGNNNKNFSISGITDGVDVVDATTPTINEFDKNGSGNLTITSSSSNSDNTFLNAGTVTMAADNAISLASPFIIFNGGTLSSGSTTGFNLGTSGGRAGVINVTDNSTISLGTGSHSLYFSASSGTLWTSGKVLTINNWQGTTSGGTAGKIFVGAATTALSSAQKVKINFTGYGTGAKLLATGELVPNTNAAPTTPSSNAVYSNVQLGSMTLSFTPGNGTNGRIIIARAGSAPGAAPTNGVTYTANTTYGAGTTLGSGYVVYNGTGSSVTVTGLSRGTTYFFDIYEYNGIGVNTVYGTRYRSSQATASSYSTVADGSWENTSVWSCSCIPPADNPITINNVITLGQNESASDLVINSGDTLKDNGFTLTISSSAINNGVHTGTGEIKFLATNNVPISGTGKYQNVESAITNSGNLNLFSNVTINNNLIITSDAVSIGSNTLTINGAFSGAGTLTGSPTSSLTIGGTSGPIPFTTTSASTRSLNNLSLVTGNTSLNTALDLYGLVSFSGTSSLNFNAQHVTLKSLNTSTATIGDIGTSTLSGATNVTAERFIPNVRRGYRTISSYGITTSTTINANWQEGQMNPTKTTVNNSVPGYGTMITGSGGNTNGFDVTQTNQSSLYYYNGSIQNYVAVPNTNVNTLDPKTPYLIYIRGDRSIDVNSQANPLPTTSTTLRQTGSLLTGDQVFTGLVGNTDGSVSNGKNFITNPFASFIDWNAVYTDNAASNISLNYYYIDERVGLQGGYVFYNKSTGIYTPDPGHGVTNVIQPGQSFFAQVYTTPGTILPAPLSFTIKESHKLNSGLNTSIFKAADALQTFRASLYYKDPVGNRIIADGTVEVYDDKYSFNVDKFDNPNVEFDENIAIIRNGVNLKIETRPTLAVKDTLLLYIDNLKVKDYEMELNPSNFPPTVTKAELIDNFKNTRTAVNLSSITVIPFSVTSDATSKAHNRFYIIFSSGSPLPVTLNNVRVSNQNNNALITWDLTSEFNMDRYEIERSANSVDFIKLGSVGSKGNSANLISYNYLDEAPNKGNNFYRIKMVDKNNMVTYSKIVKLVFGNLNNAYVTIYPNPVSGSSFNLNIGNLDKGNYPVIITNELGQVVFNKSIFNPGGNIVEIIKLNNSIKPGIYNLKIGDHTVKLIKQN